MTHTVGVVVPSKIIAGTNPVQKVMVGNDQVWPAGPDIGVLTTKLVWVDSRAFYGGTPLTFGQHQAGDLLVVIAVGTVPPTAPGGFGYTTAHQTTTSGSSIGGTVAYRIATASGSIPGTWNGVAGATTYVIRGAHQATPIGAVESIYQNTTTLVSNAPSLTLTDPSGESLVAHAHYNNANTGSWNTGDPAGFITKTKQDRMTSIQQLNTTVGLPSSLTHSSAQKTLGISVEVLAGSYVAPPPTEEPLWLYDVEQVNKGGGVVDFTLKKGLTGIDPLDEGFMFRCAQFSTLNGYVPRTFTKTFPTNGYNGLDCTVEDLYGDGTANPDYLHKTISFKVYPNYGAAADAVAAEMPAGAIKGNADSGLYHMPGDPHYDETIAEQTFDTEADAQAAGFTKYVRKTTRKKKT